MAHEAYDVIIVRRGPCREFGGHLFGQVRIEDPRHR